MTDYQTATRYIQKLYGGFGWPSVFTFIRLFITAPFEALERFVPKDGQIVDLGCGYGIFANLLGVMSEKRKILGVDLDDSKMRHAAKGIRNVDFRIADITKTEIAPVDCILLIHVLHHLNAYEEQEPLLKACVEKLKSGGKLIIAEIDRKPRWKFFLTRIADRILYNFHKPYYRFPEKMIALLGKFPVGIKTEIMHQGTPFSHITYICTKK